MLGTSSRCSASGRRWMPPRYHCAICAGRDLVGGEAPHVLDVATRRKRAAGTGEDHHPHRRIGVDALDRGDELVDRAVAGERVAHLGRVHRQRDDRTVLLVLEKFAHREAPVACRRDRAAAAVVLARPQRREVAVAAASAAARSGAIAAVAAERPAAHCASARARASRG
jgi:hypothetical protein